MATLSTQFFNGKYYDASDFVQSNINTMKNGILPNAEYFSVTPNYDMYVSVSAGRGWINGHSFQLEDGISLQIPQADGTHDRVDNIVIRLCTTVGSEFVECVVSTGNLSVETHDPLRAGDVYELVIAQIHVANGSTEITSDMISDTRGHENLCGWSGAISSDQFNFDEKASNEDIADLQSQISSGNVIADAHKIYGRTVSSVIPTAKLNYLKWISNSWKPGAIGYNSTTVTAETVGAYDYKVTFNFGSSFANKNGLIFYTSKRNTSTTYYLEFLKKCTLNASGKFIITGSTADKYELPTATFIWFD